MGTSMKRFGLNLIGCFVLAVGIQLTNLADLATSGAAGLSLTLIELIDLPFPVMFFIINLPFFILALWKLGVSYTLHSLLSVTLVTGISAGLQTIPIQDISVYSGSLLGGFLVGAGAVVIFLSQSSMGGATLLAVYLQQKNAIDPGKVIFGFDLMVASISFLLLGVQNGFLTIVNIFVCSLVISLSKKAIHTSTRQAVRA
ncbi:YitT family protein [Geomicrobium sp. JSM 1781026]|uniref:YitT family protein n=1 Tax=Geomicrobium sp. JSM 1781026 TaxID=3344580 RepID=UPI0035C1B5F7